MTFLPLRRPSARLAITSELSFRAVPLSLWLKATSTKPVMLNEPPCWVGAAELYNTVSGLAWVNPLIEIVGVLLTMRPVLEPFFEPLTPFDPLKSSVPMEVSPPVLVFELAEPSDWDALWAKDGTPLASTESPFFATLLSTTLGAPLLSPPAAVLKLPVWPEPAWPLAIVAGAFEADW